MKNTNQLLILKWGKYEKYENKEMLKKWIAENKNPYTAINKGSSCGDWCEINIATVEPRISNIWFSHKGCLLSKSAINALLSSIENKTKEEALNILFCFRQMILKSTPHPDLPEELTAFCKFSKFQSRRNCILMGCDQILRELNGAKNRE